MRSKEKERRGDNTTQTSNQLRVFVGDGGRHSRAARVLGVLERGGVALTQVCDLLHKNLP